MTNLIVMIKVPFHISYNIRKGEIGEPSFEDILEDIYITPPIKSDIINNIKEEVEVAGWNHYKENKHQYR